MLSELQTFDDTPVVEELVSIGADWAVSTALERATVMTVRGILMVTRATTLTTLRTWWAVMYVTNASAPVLTAGTDGPGDPGAYVEDVLWTGGGLQDVGNAGSVEPPVVNMERIHVKAARKITSDQEIRLAFASSGVGSWVYSVQLRCLVRRSG